MAEVGGRRSEVKGQRSEVKGRCSRLIDLSWCPSTTLRLSTFRLSTAQSAPPLSFSDGVDVEAFLAEGGVVEDISAVEDVSGFEHLS